MAAEAPTDFWELDSAILNLLPNKGAKIGKYLPDARSVAEIKKELGDDTLTSDVVATRLRVLKLKGFAILVPVVGRAHRGGNGWQRTASANTALNGGRPVIE